jgi:gamma-glutamylputrescine oxidase
MPKVASTLIPMTTYVITTAPLGEALTQAIGYRGGISDSDTADNHYRVVGGDRLMLSGRATAWVRKPQRYVRALVGDIKKTYPQLGDVAVDYAWNGTLGLTLHRMPQIGELGGGVWLASGFGGHGLNTTAMAGNLIARAIVSGDETWRQFTPFELVWAGGIFGRAAAQTRVFIKRLRLVIGARRAKARERARLLALAAELEKEAARAVAEAQSAPAPEPSAVSEEPEAAMQTAPADAASGSIVPPPAEMETSVVEAGEAEPQETPPQQTKTPAPGKRKKRRQRAKADVKTDVKADG